MCVCGGGGFTVLTHRGRLADIPVDRINTTTTTDLLQSRTLGSSDGTVPGKRHLTLHILTPVSNITYVSCASAVFRIVLT